MPDEVTESGNQTAESQGAPTPQVPSQAGGDEQTSSQSGVNAESLVEALKNPEVKKQVIEAIRPEWQKDDQSVKDRRIASLTTDVERLKGYVEKYDDFDTAVREMELDDLREQARGDSVPGRTQQPQQGSNEAYMEAKSAEILKSAGVSFDDPEYTELVENYQGKIQDPNQWFDVLSTFAGRRASKAQRKENVTSAAGVVESSSPPPQGEEALLRQMNEELKAARGKPSKTIEIKQKYRTEHGLDVW